MSAINLLKNDNRWTYLVERNKEALEQWKNTLQETLAGEVNMLRKQAKITIISKIDQKIKEFSPQEVNESEGKTEDMPVEKIDFPNMAQYQPAPKNFTQIHGGGCNLLSYLWAAFHNPIFKESIFSKIFNNENNGVIEITLHDKKYTVDYNSILRLSSGDNFDLVTAAIGQAVQKSIGAPDDDYQMIIGDQDIFGNKFSHLNKYKPNKKEENKEENQKIQLTNSGKIMCGSQQIGHGKYSIISIGIKAGTSSSNHAISVHYDFQQKAWKVFDSMGTYTEQSMEKIIESIDINSDNKNGTQKTTLNLKTGETFIYLITCDNSIKIQTDNKK